VAVARQRTGLLIILQFTDRGGLLSELKSHFISIP